MKKSREIIVPYFKKTFEEKTLLKKINQIITLIKKKPFQMPKKNTPVILLASGGFDSVIFWFYLIKKYQLKIYPLYLNNGNFSQKQAVKYYANYFKKKYPNNSFDLKIFPNRLSFLSFKKLLKKINTNFIPKELIIANITKKTNKKKYFNFFINNPLRFFYYNLFAFEYGLSLLFTKGITINTIFSGVVSDDRLISRESTLTTLRSINLSCMLIFGYDKWQFQAPIDKDNNFFLSKTDLLNFALKNDFDFSKTWSCDNNYLFHCGVCPSCQGRKFIFEINQIKDPTFYLPFWLKKLKDNLEKLKPKNLIKKSK